MALSKSSFVVAERSAVVVVVALVVCTGMLAAGRKNSDDNPGRQRRWFRFSLRTLFVVVLVVAAVAAFSSYHLRWIQARHAFRAQQLWSSESGHGLSKEDAAAVIAEGWPTAYHTDPPWALGLFGEYGIDPLCISVRKDEVQRSGDGYLISAVSSEVHTAKRLFPEAEIRVYWWEKETGTSHDVRVQP